tara:strand:- start:224 stop:418 length:195 start_codon:yes stop_codon:yes gene_type:complete
MTRDEAFQESLKKCKDLIGFEINQVSTEMIKGLPVIKLFLRKGVDHREVLVTSNQKGTKAGFIK